MRGVAEAALTHQAISLLRRYWIYILDILYYVVTALDILYRRRRGLQQFMSFVIVNLRYKSGRPFLPILFLF